MSNKPCVLLGPQSPAENLSEALKRLELTGTVCSITAGWQEREAELGALEEVIHLPVVDLALYRRADTVLSNDEALFRAHRERQAQLMEEQRLYRMRLRRYMQAAHTLMDETSNSDLLENHRSEALAAVRGLDKQHTKRLRVIHGEFANQWRLGEREGIAREIDKLAHVLESCAAVLIAGGHVGVLLSRMRLFELDKLLAGKVVVGWSAGAMAITERVVLFDDHTPNFYRVPEVFDVGLGLAPRTVALPNATTRLELDNRQRVAVFARRFSPARCVTLDPGAALTITAGSVTHAAGVTRLARDGALHKVRRR